MTEAANKPNASPVLCLLLPHPLTNFSRGRYSVLMFFRGNPAPLVFNLLNFRFGFDVIDSDLGMSDAFMSKLQMMNECKGVHY